MEAGKDPEYGAIILEDGVKFVVFSRYATKIELCLFTDGGRETRLPMKRADDGSHSLFVEGAREGLQYGFRAHGTYDPDQGHWFDPSKLLVDPYAAELDRQFVYDPLLGTVGEDTASLVPKTVVRKMIEAPQQRPLLPKGGFIYELAVRAFTMRHPSVPESQRGTIAALSHPAVIAHFKEIGVDAIELLPIVAWIDERHLPPLGLSNGWGYNPIALMAIDPRLAPGGVAELQDTVAKLHAEGIGVILDLVFNHTGESDRFGSTLSMRGLDNLTYYRYAEGQPGELINDTGTGNTLACDNPQVRTLIVDSLRHFVRYAGVDGFRFDLATIIGRSATGFHRDSETLKAIIADPILSDRILIAEPWDIGPGGYQLGNFPQPFLEWNDRVRDDLRRYWRGDAGLTGALATALAGSSDLFGRHGEEASRSVNFLAAHDGFTLKDLVSYAHKHNEANGEDNRDGHNDNHSWNNGEEGETSSPDIVQHRMRDIKALLSTLFSTRGHIMLTAGDEAGRTQRGNNNAYCQDNEITWMDWSRLDEELLRHTGFLAKLRRRFSALSDVAFFSSHGDVEWLSPSGMPMSVGEWEGADQPGMMMILRTHDAALNRQARIAIAFNRSWLTLDINLSHLDRSGRWHRLDETGEQPIDQMTAVPPRSVSFFLEY
ncbi:glycogen debranching protein GlgX [Oryzifoliimicrobium ureilyticus]|uniref:glycogen debranching protein GlgX n=1 Tax=Oryzifoliimicrobium ureilyticus TaxID=3113724 RepID=UPI003076743D